jgi:DNA-binding Lrp family transcriptional regulator
VIGSIVPWFGCPVVLTLSPTSFDSESRELRRTNPTPRTVGPVEKDTLDDLDRALVHALQVNGRASFGVVAAVLGVSDHTVARRYRRLRGAGVLRVVGLPDSRRLGHTEWLVRLRCIPDSALAIATALGRRDDISWVMLTSAGTEITCLVQTRSTGERDALLFGTLPRARQIVQVDALCVLRVFFGGATGWRGRTDALSAEQIAALSPEYTVDRSAGPVVLDERDEQVLALVRRDGRTTITDLASALGCAESSASRRLDRLVGSGAVFFDVEIAPQHLGYPVESLLWVTVAPSALETTARAVSEHPQVALVAATSGTTNLLLAVGCRDTSDLYDYVAHGIGGLPAVQAVQTAPVIRNVKRAGSTFP